MNKENIHTDQAPAAIGPYVQAVRIGKLIYTSGQGGLDPVTGKLVEGGVEAQAQQTMKNLDAVLEAAGSSFENVVKTTIFLRYMKDFQAVNAVYASYFKEQLPARSTVAVSALPKATLVEIEMVALQIDTHKSEPDKTQSVKTINEPKKKKKKKRRSKGKKKIRKK